MLQITNPFADNVNEEIYEQIVELFDLQPNNLRRSISSDGTVSYIENNATVEISPIGRIDYKAVDEKKGILAETLYDKLNLVWELAKKQYNLIVPNQPFNARIISELIEANQDILYIK